MLIQKIQFPQRRKEKRPCQLQRNLQCQFNIENIEILVRSETKRILQETKPHK